MWLGLLPIIINIGMGVQQKHQEEMWAFIKILVLLSGAGSGIPSVETRITREWDTRRAEATDGRGTIATVSVLVGLSPWLLSQWLTD